MYTYIYILYTYIHIYTYIYLYHPHKTTRPNVLGVLPREAGDLPGSGAIAPPENIQALLS